MVLLPISANFCNGSFVNESACEVRLSDFRGERTTWDNSSMNSWEPLGEANILSVTGLSQFTTESVDASVQTYGTVNIGLDGGRIYNNILLTNLTSAGMQNLIMTDQITAGLKSKTFSTALFGLSNAAINLGRGKTKTFLKNLRETYSIGSMSLSYTAGSYARKWQPSLVLGGYDSTRLDATTTLEVDIEDLTESVSHFPLGVNTTAITVIINQSADINIQIDSPLSVNIDPVTPQIWLPDKICDELQEAFRLQWDEASKYYFVNESTHKWLLETNPSIVFSLSSSRSRHAVKNFTLSYQTTFDMNLTYPLVDTWKRYFPLKRGRGMLGRAFFQETHISIDYDSKYFNISQARPGNDKTRLVAIEPRANTTVQGVVPPTEDNPKSTPEHPPEDSPEDSPEHSPSQSLSPGVYTGIGLGAAALAFAIVFLILARSKGWWPFKGLKEQQTTEAGYDKPELHNTTVSQVTLVEAMDRERAELDTLEPLQEIAQLEVRSRGVADSVHIQELDAELRPTNVHGRSNSNIKDQI